MAFLKGFNGKVSFYVRSCLFINHLYFGFLVEINQVLVFLTLVSAGVDSP